MCHARAVRSDGIRPERSELTRNDDGRPAPICFENGRGRAREIYRGAFTLKIKCHRDINAAAYVER